MKHKHSGNVKAQNLRRKARRSVTNQIPITKKAWQTVDGNWTNKPYAFCTHYGLCLTYGLYEAHRCNHRHCSRLKFIDFKKHDS